jgi:predicted nucleic acid-binding protein
VTRVVYVDTGAWIALLWARDKAHQRMARHFRALREARDLLVTSEPAIGETATRLRHDAGLSATLAFQRYLEAAVATGELRIRDTDRGLRQRAFELMSRHVDLPLSYADCVGAAVAEEVGAGSILGLDNDFRVLGFVLEP